MDHHTKAEEVGTVFSRVQPKLAVLYHIVLLTDGKIPAPTENDVVEKARTTYSGNIVVAEDLMRFSVARDGVKHRMP
jgi:ribonuclease BN (tRNA processing enzyme)